MWARVFGVTRHDRLVEFLFDVVGMEAGAGTSGVSVAAHLGHLAKFRFSADEEL